MDLTDHTKIQSQAPDAELDPAAAADRLVAAIKALGPCIVAFSGGVDSAVVAKAAFLALGDQALAATGVGASLASGELAAAQAVAANIGIAHVAVDTDEIAVAEYQRNAPDRCFHCKTELYSRLRSELDPEARRVLVNGANADDLGDFRPGMRAAADFLVRSPLAELGVTKRGVRALAAHWELPVHDKPATPCLSSRVAYGVAVTPERLARIDAAESYLRARGFTDVRVRCHDGELARIEIDAAQIAELVAADMRQQVAAEFRRLGFRFITVDVEGFRSGSFKPLIPVEMLQAYQPKA